VLYNIYAPLVEVDAVYNPKPGLAESWDVSPDLKTYTFKLRRGVKFQDGTDFTAAAVKFHFDRIVDPATKATVALPYLQSLEVVDDYTVRFNLKSPSVAFPNVLNERAGLIPSPVAVQKYGQDFGRNPVGAGPFRFVEWLQDDHITLQRFDGYYQKGLPYLDQVIFKMIPDSAVLLTNLRSGNVDLMQNPPDADLARLKDSTELKTQIAPGTTTYQMYINSKRAPFDNKALRQAVAYAVDRDAIVKGLTFGLHPVAQGLLNPSSWAYDPNIHPYTRDLEKAKQKLVEGGQPNGFSFELVIPSNPEYRAYAEAIMGQLAEVGIKAQPRSVSLTEAAGLTGGRDQAYQALAGTIVARPDPDLAFTDASHSTGGHNYGRYGADAPIIDQLIEKARATADPAARKEIYRQLQQTINDEALDVFFYQRSISAVMSPKVQGYKVVADSAYRNLPGTWLQP